MAPRHHSGDDHAVGVIHDLDYLLIEDPVNVPATDAIKPAAKVITVAITGVMRVTSLAMVIDMAAVMARVSRPAMGARVTAAPVVGPDLTTDQKTKGKSDCADQIP
jgi:hypothetical protein